MKNIKDSIFWIKNRLLRPKSYYAYMKSLEYDRLSGMEKSNREFSKMKELVEYAYSHVSFYKKFYDEHHFHPSMLKSIEDWDSVPIIEKDIVRFKTQSLLSDQYQFSDLKQFSTSGSTGTPLKVFKEKNIPVEVMGWRALYWWNLSPAADMAKLHRNAPTTMLAKLKNKLLWWPTKRVFLNSSTLITDKMISDFLKKINSSNICWIQGYSSSIESVADYIIKHRLQTPSIKMVWWTSAPLTQMIRKKIENAYGCNVMDQYGCNEMWNIAIQKKEEPYLTVCTDFVHVDVVDMNGKNLSTNKKGDILITDLNCKAFPLIKYRLGDKGSFAMTSIESNDGYPKLNFIDGRTSDNIIFPNGKKIDGVYLTAICDVCPDVISSYQVYQYSDYSVSLRIVLKDGISKDHIEIKKIYEGLGNIIKDNIPYRIEFLKSIPPIKGKKRYIISEIGIKNN